MLRLKRDHPDLQMRMNSPLLGQQSMQIIALSKLPDDPINKDVRIQHAISMLIDREGYLEAFFNVSGLRNEGIPVETGWHTHVPCSWPNHWLDPRENKLGEASKYFQHNPEEAAQLLRAADAFGLETTFTTDTRTTTAQRTDVFLAMLQEGGHFKLQTQLLDYSGDYLPNFVFNQGKFPGISSEHTNGAWPDFDFPLFVLYHPNGRNAMVTEPLPKIHDIMVRHRQERDEQTRIELAHEWQKEMALQMPTVPHPGMATTFTLNWPWLKNFGYFQILSVYNQNQELLPHYWYDSSQDNRS